MGTDRQAGIDGDFIPRRSERVRFRFLGGEMIVLHQEKAEILGLDELGGRIFQLMDGTRSLDEIVDLLIAKYDVCRETLLADMITFTEDLTAAGLFSERTKE